MGNPLEAEFVEAGHTSEDKAEALAGQDRSAFTAGDGEVVDTETVRQFIEQLDEQAGLDEAAFASLREELAEKQRAFADLLEGVPDLEEREVEFLLRNVFAVRNRRAEVLEAVDVDRFNRLAEDLLEGSGQRAERFDAFCEGLAGVEDRVSWSLASELLHHSDPAEHAIWTRWLWNPDSRTGALPLVTMADVDLDGETPGETYEAVDRAVHDVEDHVGEMGFDPEVLEGPLGTDVALATVHATYTYLVLGMRMTREFTEAIPDHPEYVRRLLGTIEIHRQREG